MDQASQDFRAGRQRALSVGGDVSVPSWPTANLSYEAVVDAHERERMEHTRIRLIEQEEEEVALCDALGLSADANLIERVLFVIFSTCGRFSFG
ncbi:MAG: hypothetical protein AAB480_04820 [Patescibacteria group bacterium]